MRISSQTHTLDDWFGMEQAVDIMVRSGYDGLDYSMFSHDFAYLFENGWKERAQALRARAEALGAVFNQAHAPFGGGYEFYTGQIAPILPRVFEVAAAMGVPVVVVHPVQNGRYYGHEKELFEGNLRFYRMLAPYAKDCGLRIGIENMWQNHPVSRHIVDDVCAPPEELAALFDELDDPDAFTVCLDIGHCAVCGREPDACIRYLGPDRMGALHVHDVDYVNDNHSLPGVFSINWDAVCRALGEIGYHGDLTLESDAFLRGFGRDFAETSCAFMAARARFLANAIDRYRKAP